MLGMDKLIRLEGRDCVCSIELRVETFRMITRVGSVIRREGDTEVTGVGHHQVMGSVLLS